MFDYTHFVHGIISLLTSLLQLYMWIVIIRVLLSWINLDPGNPVVVFLRGITDPAIDSLRRVLPPFFWSTGLDFTPLILILLLQIVVLLLESFRLG